MIARQIITDEIVPLKTSDTGKRALGWMDEYKVSHLPIVNDEVLLGLISEQDIYNLDSANEPLGNHALSLEHPYVNEHQHIYDVLKLIHRQNISLIPVLDDQQKYLGAITLRNLVRFLAGTFSVDNPGGVIVLELSQQDYSLVEISTIVESNNAKVLSTFITSHKDSTRIEVAVKVNKVELGGILQTFDRYGYFVKATFGEDRDQEDLKDRFDSLMNYLNI